MTATIDVSPLDPDDYLAAHFIEEAALARRCRVSIDALRARVADRSMPGPSYVRTRGALWSQPFGERACAKGRPGRYYAQVAPSWFAAGRELVDAVGPQDAPGVSRKGFVARLRVALCEFDRTLWRLTDAYTDGGAPIEVGLDERVESTWTHWLAGTYGVCVVRPLSERDIARKDVLQEKLDGLVAAADRPLRDVPGLIETLDAYDRVCMPFSPVEYPATSRRRLIDDVRQRLRQERAQP